MPRASNADNRVTGLIEYTANGVPHFSMIALATSGGQQAHDCRSRTAAGVGHPTTPLPSWNAINRRRAAGETAGSSWKPRSLDLRSSVQRVACLGPKSVVGRVGPGLPLAG